MVRAVGRIAKESGTIDQSCLKCFAGDQTGARRQANQARRRETDPGQHGSALDFWMRQGLVVPACVVIPAVGESRFGRRDFFGELLKHGFKFVDCPVFLGNSQPEERLVRFQEPGTTAPWISLVSSTGSIGGVTGAIPILSSPAS